MNVHFKSKFVIGCLTLVAVSWSNSNMAQQEKPRVSESEGTFTINLDVSTCQEEPNYKSEFVENIDSVSASRTIISNSIPNHSIGVFPNSGNPNRIQPQNQSYAMVLEPRYTGKAYPGQGYSFGVLLN